MLPCYATMPLQLAHDAVTTAPLLDKIVMLPAYSIESLLLTGLVRAYSLSFAWQSSDRYPPAIYLCLACGFTGQCLSRMGYCMLRPDSVSWCYSKQQLLSELLAQAVLSDASHQAFHACCFPFPAAHCWTMCVLLVPQLSLF